MTIDTTHQPRWLLREHFQRTTEVKPWNYLINCSKRYRRSNYNDLVSCFGWAWGPCTTRCLVIEWEQYCKIYLPFSLIRSKGSHSWRQLETHVVRSGYVMGQWDQFLDSQQGSDHFAVARPLVNIQRDKNYWHIPSNVTQKYVERECSCIALPTTILDSLAVFTLFIVGLSWPILPSSRERGPFLLTYHTFCS